MKKELFLKFDSGTNVNCMAHAGEGSIELIEAKDGESKGNKAFRMNLYNGGAMNVGFHMPVVIDLAGMKVSGKNRPILLNHDTSHPIGHTTRVEIGAKAIKVEGEISFDNEDTKNVIASSKNGFPWQASVGANVMKLVRVDEGETAEANGRKFKGPILIARQSEMKEGSFVPLGADDTTSVKVAANGTAYFEGMELSMTFKKWLKACGYDVTKLSADELKGLEAHYNKLVEAKDPSVVEAKPEPKKPEPKTEEVKAEDKPVTESGIKALLDKHMSDYTARLENVTEINSLTASHPEIKTEALKKGWDADHVKAKVELANIRAGYPQNNFNINSGTSGNVDEKTLMAAAMQSGRINEKSIIAECGEKALEVAHREFKGRLSLQELFYVAAKQNGYSGAMTMRQDMPGVFRAAMEKGLKAAHSTISLPGILSNIANKFFIDAFNHVESTWREVSAVGSVNDFKQTTRLSLTSDMEYKKVNPGGQIEHGELGEETYLNQADTYARLYSIDRTTLINDDLGALTTMMAQLGKGAADAFNLAFWTEFMNNSSFFSSGNKNLTATSNPLSIDELSAMELLFFDQVKPNDTPYGAQAEILLVSNANWILAQQLVRTTTIELDGSAAATKIPDSNPHAGRFTPVRSSFLSNIAIPGFSTTASYLLSRPSPGGLSVIESVFLNGQETPTIETGDVDFSQLGIQFRGWHDFGMNKQEFREGVKSPGA